MTLCTHTGPIVVIITGIVFPEIYALLARPHWGYWRYRSSLLSDWL